LNLQTTQIVP